jgi:hypothetical protein
MTSPAAAEPTRRAHNVRRWLSAVALSAVAALGAAGRADAYIYWSGGSTIGRANLDGSGVNSAFISGIRPFSVAVDGAHIYWADHDAGAIGRANLDGTGVTPRFITGAHDPLGVTSDGAHVYWANHADATIGRASVDGTQVDQGFVSSPYAPAGAPSALDVAVDSDHVYWSSSSTQGIGRANLDGSGGQLDWLFRVDQPYGVDVDGAHIWWANGGTVGRANLDGTDIVTGFITTGGLNASGLAVDRAHVYWSDPRLGIGRANLDGTGQRDLIQNIGPYSIAVDALGPGAPQLRRLRIAPRRFRDRGPHRGATVRYVDSEAATTTFTVLAARAGVRRGARCVPRTRKGRACVRYVAIQRFRRTDVAGANRFHFSALFAGRPLPPGRYRLTARPSLAGTRGATRVVAFRILP